MMISWIFGLATALLLVLYNFALALPNVFDPDITRLILFFLLLSASVLCARWMSLLVASAALQGKRNLSGLVFLLVGVLVFIPALAADLHFVLHVDLAALLTTSAIVTALIGFALQSTLANLFEGLAMHLHRPFKLGDVVFYEGVYGAIEDLSWRALRIRQEDGQSLIVPNSALARGSIRVLSDGDALRIVAPFAAPADVEPRRVLRAAEEAVAGLEEVLATPAPQILIASFNHTDTTVQYSAQVWIDGTRMDRNAVRSRLYERVWYALARDGIPFGFLLFDAPHRLSLTSDKSEESGRELAESVLRDLTSEARSYLLAKSRLIMFGPSELVSLSSSQGPLAMIIVSGMINIPVSDDLPVIGGDERRPIWSADELQSVTDHLRNAIGPAAQHIVAGIAPQTSDLHILYQRLAEQVPNEHARHVFLARGPRQRVVTKRAGHTLGFAAVLGRNFLSESSPVCRMASAVLRFDADDLREVLRNSPSDAAAFAAIVSAEFEVAGRPRPLGEIEEEIRWSFPPHPGAAVPTH